MKLVQEVNIEVSDQERTCWGNVSVQNLFAEMDEEEDGHVYVKQVVVTLKALNQDIDHNLKVVHISIVHPYFHLCIPILNLQVKNILDELDNDEKTEATVSFKEFKDLMVILEEAGWRKQKPKKVISFTESSFKSFWYHKVKEITDMDLKAVFRLVDVDKSGNISRTVSYSGSSDNRTIYNCILL